MKRIEQPEYREPDDLRANDNFPLVVHAQPGRLNPNLVILIHGLTGHRYGYWGQMPKFLFEDLNNTDIGLYFYRTALKRFNIFKSIDLQEEGKVLADELRRLKFYGTIALVGHSMGGLLAKAAIASLIERNLQQQLKKISGLLLLASPQLGSFRVPSWAMLLSRDGRALYPHNDLIRRINTAFSSRLSLDQTEDPRGRFTIPTWALIGAEDYWVDALSADIGIPEQQKLTIRTGHGGVKAPTDRSDESYTYVRDCLEITLKPRASLESEEEEISVEDASISNVAAIRTIATSFFGEEVTPVGVLEDFTQAKGILVVVKRIITNTQERRERISGYMCLIPITKQVYSDICEGRIRGADLSTDHVPTTRPETFAIYIGGVAASDFYSRAVVLEALRLRINYERELGVRHFLTRPVTNDGLRLTRRNHFKPVNGKGQGELYTLNVA